MAAINFPDSPSLNDTFNVGDKTWRWDGSYWRILALPSDIDTLIKDADNDTKVQVEESADEDIIRFDVAGVEKMTLDALGLDVVDDLDVHGSIVADANITATGSLTGALKSVQEVWNIVASAPPSATNIDVLTSSAWYYTSDSTDVIELNIRGDSGTTLGSLLGVGDSITIAVLITNGATPYYISAIQVDGDNTIVPAWQNGVAPSSGNASAIDAYTITVVKTAATPTYKVLAGVVEFS